MSSNDEKMAAGAHPRDNYTYAILYLFRNRTVMTNVANRAEYRSTVRLVGYAVNVRIRYSIRWTLLRGRAARLFYKSLYSRSSRMRRFFIIVRTYRTRKRPRESVAGARVSLLREKDPFRTTTYDKLLHFPRSPPGSFYFHGGRNCRGRYFAGAHNVTCGDMCVRAPGPQPTCNGHCRMHIALPAHHSSLRTVCKTHCQTMCS